MLSCLWDGAYKRTLALIGKSSPCSGDSGFSLSLCEWFLTICLTSYDLEHSVLSASINKVFRSFVPNEFQLLYH